MVIVPQAPWIARRQSRTAEPYPPGAGVGASLGASGGYTLVTRMVISLAIAQFGLPRSHRDDQRVAPDPFRIRPGQAVLPGPGRSRLSSMTDAAPSMSSTSDSDVAIDAGVGADPVRVPSPHGSASRSGAHTLHRVLGRTGTVITTCRPRIRVLMTTRARGEDNTTRELDGTDIAHTGIVKVLGHEGECLVRTASPYSA